jgi:hypothetical protein
MCDEELDVARCVAIPHPAAQIMGKEVKVGLAHTVIAYFQEIGDEIGLSAEHVMAIYLRHVADSGYKVAIDLPRLQRENALEE